MKFKKILFWDFIEDTLPKKYWDQIDELTEEKVLLPKDSPDIEKHLDADCLLVCFLPVVDKARIDSMPNLKYVGILATGYSRMDHEYAKTKGIPVCNIPGYSSESVAEFAFAVVLEKIRDLERAKQTTRSGIYSQEGFTATELRDKVFSIIGLGNIGSRIAEIALGFGCDVRYWSRNRKEKYENKGIKYQDLDSLLKESDFISLNLSLNENTKGILNKDRIQMIKPNTIMINLSPMELLDSNALLARQDITFIYDHSDEISKELNEKFVQHKNFIGYPPIAYLSNEARERLRIIFINNIKGFLEGNPINKVN